MQAKVDTTKCIGCELCIQFCPDAITMEGEFATFIVDFIPDDMHTACLDAAEFCPVDAIIIEN